MRPAAPVPAPVPSPEAAPLATPDLAAPPELPDITLSPTPIHRGPLAALYRGWDRVHRCDVVVKAQRATGDAVAGERFRREAAVMGRLRHPNIVTLYRFLDGDPAALVMEFVPGRTLAAAVGKDGWLSPARAASVIEGVAAALDCAHAQGIIHRDVKPGNILLPPRAPVKLTDFGVARIDQAEGDAPLTVMGDILGTIEYASPEQVHGKETADARSDVYSLAAVAYFALTATPPFRAADESTQAQLSVMHRQVFADPPPLRFHREELPPPVEQAVLRGLAKAPDKRYQSAGQFAAALRAAVEAERGAPEERAMAANARRTGALAGALAAATLLLLGGIGLLSLRHPTGSALGPTTPLPAPTRPQLPASAPPRPAPVQVQVPPAPRPAVPPPAPRPAVAIAPPAPRAAPKSAAALIKPPVSRPVVAVKPPVPKPIVLVTPKTARVAVKPPPRKPVPSPTVAVVKPPTPRPVVAVKPPAPKAMPKPSVAIAPNIPTEPRRVIPPVVVAAAPRPKPHPKPVLVAQHPPHARPAAIALITPSAPKQSVPVKAWRAKAAPGWLFVYANQNVAPIGRPARMANIPAQMVYVDGQAMPALAAGKWAAVTPGQHIVSYFPASGSGFSPRTDVVVRLFSRVRLSRQISLAAQTGAATRFAAVPAETAPARPISVRPPSTGPGPLPRMGWLAVYGASVADKGTHVPARTVIVDGRSQPPLAHSQWITLPAGRHVVTFEPQPGLEVGTATVTIRLLPQAHLLQPIALPAAIPTHLRNP